MAPKTKQRTCHKCHKTFEGTPQARQCEACHEADRRADPRNYCKTCGNYHRHCYLGICPPCKKAEFVARRAERERPKENRRRTLAEQYVDLYMEKHGPDSESLSPRRHLSLDRKMASLYKKLVDNKFEEWKALVYLVAWQGGMLSEERYKWFRSYEEYSDTFRKAFAQLHHELWGKPSGWRETYLIGYDLDLVKKVLPDLRAKLENPDHPLGQSSAKQDPMPTQKASEEKTEGEKEKRVNFLDIFSVFFYMREDEKRKTSIRRFWAESGKGDLLASIGYTIEEVLAEGEIEPKPIHPEQVDADDQDAIDAAFAELMEGFEL